MNNGISDKSILEIKNVNKRFGGVLAVDKVSFSVGEGEIVGICGDNGAGKSTLIKMIAGVYSPDSGGIYLKGTKIDGKSPKEIREIGIETIFQDLALAENFNAESNIFLGREPIKNRFLKNLDFKYMREKTIETLKKISFEFPDITTRVYYLSGGQRQGVAIARAIHWGKKIIIMDEPTAALGVKESLKVLGLIKETIKCVKAIILITHNMENLIKVADRTIILRNGKLVSKINFKDYEGRLNDLHNDIVKAITGIS